MKFYVVDIRHEKYFKEYGGGTTSNIDEAFLYDSDEFTGRHLYEMCKIPDFGAKIIKIRDSDFLDSILDR